MTKSTKLFGGRRRSLIDSPLWPSRVEEMHGISPECAEDYHHECPGRLRRMLVNSLQVCDCWCHNNRRRRKRSEAGAPKLVLRGQPSATCQQYITSPRSTRLFVSKPVINIQHELPFWRSQWTEESNYIFGQ